jgi:hypothetical protein
MTARNPSSFLPHLLGPLNLEVNGVAVDVERRETVNLVGTFEVTDDPDGERTQISIDWGGTVLANTSTGTLNDVTTTSAGANVTGVRFSGAAPTVTGLTGGETDRRLILAATGGNVVIANEDAGSTAANRIVTGTGGNVTLANGAAAYLVYDATSLRWRLVSTGGGSGGVPGGSNDEIQTNNAGTFAGATNVKAGSSYVSIGATPASAGHLRLPSGSSVRVRNQPDSADVYLCDATVSATETYCTIGADVSGTTANTAHRVHAYARDRVVLKTWTTPKTVSLIDGEGLVFEAGLNFSFLGKSPNTTTVGGGSGVLFIGNATTNPSTNPTAGVILYVDSADNALKYRKADGTTVTVGAGTPAGSTNELQVNAGGGSFGAASNVTAGTNYIAIGASGAATGYLRLPYLTPETAIIRGKYSAGSEASILRQNAGTLQLGDVTGWVTNVYSYGVNLYSKTNDLVFYQGTGGGEVARFTGGTHYASTVHRLGYSTVFSSDGRATQAMADANQTLAAAVYSRSLWKFTGANTSARTATAPHPGSEDASYVKAIDNSCTGSDLVISTGTGTTVTFTAGTGGVCWFTPSGVQKIAP